MPDTTPHLDDLNARSKEVFRRVVESYLDSGMPVGSRTLTRTLSEQVSAATIRNVMQDLEHLGLLDLVRYTYTFLQGPARRSVVQRDDDVLTPGKKTTLARY